MSGNIIFENATCNACGHREICKYKEAEAKEAMQLKMERFAPLISDPFVVIVSCRYFK